MSNKPTPGSEVLLARPDLYTTSCSFLGPLCLQWEAKMEVHGCVFTQICGRLGIDKDFSPSLIFFFFFFCYVESESFQTTNKIDLN